MAPTPTFEHNRICQLFGIRYPIVQAGMIWNSGWQLASAAARAGILGLIGSGGLYPNQLRENILRCQEAVGEQGVFGVNVPLLYPAIEEHMALIEELKVPIVFTSAGNPKTWTPWLKERGRTVVHVSPSVKFARKAQEAGVDAVVCEGFEAGGHNGREETTSMVLIPSARPQLDIPLIAAGGIGSGAAMLAALALGAEGVQVGSRFAASQEGTGHTHFKQAIVEAGEGGTELVMKKLVPVRLLKNQFYQEIKELEDRGASREELAEHLGRARAKRGMYEGDLDNGELEIGQIAGAITDLPAVQDIVDRFLDEYRTLKAQIAAGEGRF